MKVLWCSNNLMQKMTSITPFYLWKDQIILATGRGILADFWVPHEIESWNFQHMLDLWFSEASQNLSSFRQLLFSLFHGGDQREKSENPKKRQMSGIHIWESCSPLYFHQNCHFFRNNKIFCTIMHTNVYAFSKL